MADDVTLNSMTGGDVIAADEISGVKYQRVKIVEGDNGTNDGDISATNPLPVTAVLTTGSAAIGKLAANSAVDIGDVDVISIVPGVAATNLGKAEDGVHGSGDVGVLGLAVRQAANNPLSGSDGDYEPLQTDANGHLKVNIIDALPAGTNAIGKLAANNGVDIGDVDIPGSTIAHDAADSGNPHKIGAKASSALSGITLVANNDRTDLYADLDGQQIQKPLCPFGDILSECVSNTNGTSTASAVFTATAGVKNFITTIIAYNTSATAGYVDIRDGTAGAIIACIPLPANGGCAISFPVPLKQPTANTALAFDVSGALTTVYLTFIGFKSKVA